mgnify:FL=1
MLFRQNALQTLDEYFKQMGQRQDQCVYFYRINTYNEAIKNFVRRYYEVARKNGVIIEGKIPNPDEKNLSYYAEIMGMDFQMSPGFMESGLKKWLPRMNDVQRKNVTMSLYDTLDGMRKAGKTENMLKNAYIKFMCWLYYKFERIVNQLGQDDVPKILYEGDISSYELKLFCILSGAGCDIVLLQYHGDAEYLKLDAGSACSRNYETADGQQFPADFNLEAIRKEQTLLAQRSRLYGGLPPWNACTNAWITGKGITDILKPIYARGKDKQFYYNCFIRIKGVEDKVSYVNDLYQMYLELKVNNRTPVICEGSIPPPDLEEISRIHRSNYKSVEQMLINLSANIQYPANKDLRNIMNRAFMDVLLKESEQADMNLNRLTNKAIYLLCWLNRYGSGLFSNWEYPQTGCFIKLGGCKTENEAVFLRFLAGLPVDVLVLVPDRNENCCLEDPLLYEKNEKESFTLRHFPTEQTGMQVGTAAYHAERELDDILYQETGIYRNQQYARANAVTLKTMYEEISILWDQELKYRPNFSVTEDMVNIPVIFAKVSGVKDGNRQEYWNSIRKLITEDTYVIREVPHLRSTDENPVKPYVTEFFKNGRLLKDKIKSHRAYPYGYLREEIQNHILDKLQLLIEQRIIKGTFENGTEYTVISVVMNLNKEILKMLQKFDFTKKNPKCLYINTGEKIISLEDSILMAFLNLAGFDIVFFVPSGYQNVENYFNKKVMEEHQIGEYVYDLTVPDLMSSNIHRSWRDKLFRWGN